MTQFRIKTQNLKRQSRAESISKEENQHDPFLSRVSFLLLWQIAEMNSKDKKRRLFRLTFRRFSVPQLWGLLWGNTSLGVCRAEGPFLPWSLRTRPTGRGRVLLPLWSTIKLLTRAQRSKFQYLLIISQTGDRDFNKGTYGEHLKSKLKCKYLRGSQSEKELCAF